MADFEEGLQARLRERFGSALLGFTGERDQTCVHVKRDAARALLAFLRDDPAARFEMLTDLTAVDFLRWPDEFPPEKGGVPELIARPPERFAIVYQLLSLAHNARLRVRAGVPEEDCGLPTAADLWPAAGWAEREVFDLFGVEFRGHPDLRRILMPDDYSGHPLRKDYPLKGRGERDRLPKYTDEPAAPPPKPPRARPAGVAETLCLNFGPQHPATHGTLRFKLEVSGEVILRCEPEIGFLHTGFEKLGEYRSYNQFVTLSDRLNYLSPLNNNLGYAIACEELFGLEVPPRGRYLRVILAELSRIADHVVCVGLQGMDLGAFSAMLWTFIEREKLYDIFEAVTGARLTTSWTRVGGVFRDAPEAFPQLVRAFLEKFPPVIAEVEKALSRNKIFMDRTVGVGRLTREQALAWGVTGPCLRASAVPYDVRRARPYLCYRDLDFEIPIRTEGDAYARYLVRLEEMRQSVKIVRQALEKLPRGPVSVQDFKISLPEKDAVYTDMESLIHHFKQLMPGHGLRPPVGEVYSCTESPNGELGFYLVSDGSGQPYRLRVRPPSFYHQQTFPMQVEGRMIPDAVAALSSLNVIAGELDR